VKAQVVVEEGLRLMERRIHAGDLVRERRDLLRRRPLRGQRRRPGLQHAAHLPEAPQIQSVEGGDEPQRLADERRRTGGDDRSGARRPRYLAVYLSPCCTTCQESLATGPT